MKKYLWNYYQEMEEKIKKQNTFSAKEIEEHLIKIQFFQHERMIHLLVTLFYALFTILSFFLALFHPLLFVISLFLLIFLIFYVIHYFFLENTVQNLYKQYDKMKQKERSSFFKQFFS